MPSGEQRQTPFPEGVAFKHEMGPLIPAGTADQNGVPLATE
jgi:hypothetical protein